jgi:hypothetical protein
MALSWYGWRMGSSELRRPSSTSVEWCSPFAGAEHAASSPIPLHECTIMHGALLRPDVATLQILGCVMCCYGPYAELYAWQLQAYNTGCRGLCMLGAANQYVHRVRACHAWCSGAA